MASTQFVLAYATRFQMSDREIVARRESATEHVSTLFSTPVVCHSVGDGHTGILVWQSSAETRKWPAFAHEGGTAAAWIHVPATAGAPGDGADAIGAARAATDAASDPALIGAPCAALYRDASGLRVVNDVYGMVRLYQFTMPNFGTVWCTRPGLAHVFAGELPRHDFIAWSEMASLGWPATGRAFLGHGSQMPACSLAVATPTGEVSCHSRSDEWMSSILEGPAPRIDEAARSMADSLRTAA